MAHLSRPYQIAIVALLVVAVAWVGLAHRHSSSSEPGSSSTSSQSSSAPAAASAGSSAAAATTGPPAGAPAASSAAHEKSPATPSPIYHGSAPGLQGLSRDVAKAHEAVATSQSNARTLEAKSAQASGEGSPAPASAPASSSASAAASSSPSAAATTRSSSPATTRSTSPSTRSKATAPGSAREATRSPAPPANAPSGQRNVELALAHGKVAVVLFWNPLGAEDEAVHAQVQRLVHSHLPVAVYQGYAQAVANYGAITRQVPVYATPTILVVAKNGQTTVLTGLQERFAIEQAIEEARSA